MSRVSPENDNIRKNQKEFKKSYADAGFSSLMVGLGETYLPAFGLTFGLSQLGAGLLSSLPLLTGGILQLMAPRIAHALGSCKKWVILCASSQVIVFILLALMGLSEKVAPSSLFALASLYWCANLAAAPSWNNWIEQIVPQAELRPFFAVRSRITQIAAFLAFLIGGLWLQEAHKNHSIIYGYLVLFMAAALFRLVSIGLLTIQREQREPSIPKTMRVKVREAMRTFGRVPETTFLVYLLGTQVMVQISGPYFTPYMLGELKFSYATYAVLIAVNYAARIVAYPFLSRLVQRYGTYTSLRLGGILIAVSPLSWALFREPLLLGIAQVFAGFAWALYELANTLMIFERIPASKRTSILSCYNFLNTLAIVTGSLIGGMILYFVPKDYAYVALFAASGAGRLMTLGVLSGLRLKFRKTSRPPSTPVVLHTGAATSMTPEPLSRTS